MLIFLPSKNVIQFLLDLKIGHILEKNFTSNPKILEKNILIKTKQFKKITLQDIIWKTSFQTSYLF